ncbi:MAG: hypothetical protein LBR79_06635 [Oscillospiraceae bacterium]|nr:hypothetical protein [Oscillospiraceae bacterium]
MFFQRSQVILCDFYILKLKPPSSPPPMAGGEKEKISTVLRRDQCTVISFSLMLEYIHD